jgi:hypothetical protein
MVIAYGLIFLLQLSERGWIVMSKKGGVIVRPPTADGIHPEPRTRHWPGFSPRHEFLAVTHSEGAMNGDGATVRPGASDDLVRFVEAARLLPITILIGSKCH